VHRLDSWIKRDQLDVTCFFISLLNAQHVSDVNTSILRSLRLICWVISWVVLVWFDMCWCYVVVWLGWCGIRMQAEALLQSNTIHEITQQISRKQLRMDVLTSETFWELNNEIKEQVTSSWSLFIQHTGYADCLLPSCQHNLYDIYLLLCIPCWTPDDGKKTCPKHVEFCSKNKFEKLVHIVGFIVRI